jgi:O-antigen/teichoic acid export membrane protein
MLTVPAEKPKTLRARILSGSVILLSGSGLATAVNLAYNIAVARFLGPDGFGNATAVYTLLTLISAITLSFQIVSAKVVAQQKTPEEKSAGYRSFHRSAWACGIAVALTLVVFQNAISDYLNLRSPVLVVLLAIGVAFYVPLGSRRGYLQGAYGFRSLATSLVLEGVVRLLGSLLLIEVGWGVRGVIAANSAAVAVAYFAIVPSLTGRMRNPLPVSHAFREMSQAVIFFSGQVLLNNCDIVLVKHFFLAEAAGLYAAVAMVGRVVFAFSQAVVNSMFPLVAGTRDEERKDLTVIATALMMVLGIGSAMAICLRFTPAWMWTAFFGAKFAIAGKYNLPYLLALYAITTVIYCLSAVIITYEMSYKIANTSWIQLGFSGVVIAGICLFHSSLRQVILVQLVLMVVLLISIALPFLAASVTDTFRTHKTGGPLRLLKTVRRVTEHEVIAEFLKSDYNNPGFASRHATDPDIILQPDLENPVQNAQRRAIFFLRHLALWNELPGDTEWYEMEIQEADLGQIRVFPRAQWRKIARGDYSITEIVESIRTHPSAIDRRFLSKIEEIGENLKNGSVLGPVILIGVRENQPLTILDGNHRLVASMLASPSKVRQLRFLCGLSPRMTECCWYNTNFVTLMRYGKNVLGQVVGLSRLRGGTLEKSWMTETRE